jgi:predicted nucleic acid-binding protein
MDSYSIDTDVLIDHLMAKSGALRFLRQIAGEGAFVSYSVIGKEEIYSGIQPEEEAAVNRLFRGMREIPVDGEVAEMAGRYRKVLYASHGVLLPDGRSFGQE